MVLFKLLDKSVGLISTLVLARLLTPGDFGLVAMAMAVVAFTQLMGAFGFDSALIQRKDAERRHFDTAWTFNVAFGVLVFIALTALAWPMASFYGDPRLVAILLVLAVGSLVAGFENIGVVAFRKQLDFRSEFRFLMTKRLATFVVTMACAFTFRSYWALVIGIVFGRLLGVLISYRLHPYRPRLTLSARQELMHFSQWIFVSNLVGFVGGRSTDFILGRTVGPHGLGVYSIAYEIATMPSTELIAPVNRAVYPAYAKLAAEPAQLRERFIQIFGLICLFAFPVSAGLFAAADTFVLTVLGPQWVEAPSLIRVFAFCGLAGALQSNLYLVIVAMGKPKANTLLSAVVAALTMPVIVWASLNYGVVGAAYAVLTQAVVGLIGIWINFVVHTGFPGRRVAAVAARPAICSAAMAAGMVFLDQQPLQHAMPGLRLVALVGFGALLYSSLLLALWYLAGRPQSAEHHALTFIRERISRLRKGVRHG